MVGVCPVAGGGGLGGSAETKQQQPPSKESSRATATENDSGTVALPALIFSLHIFLLSFASYSLRTLCSHKDSFLFSCNSLLKCFHKACLIDVTQTLENLSGDFGLSIFPILCLEEVGNMGENLSLFVTQFLVLQDSQPELFPLTIHACGSCFSTARKSCYCNGPAPITQALRLPFPKVYNCDRNLVCARLPL